MRDLWKEEDLLAHFDEVKAVTIFEKLVEIEFESGDELSIYVNGEGKIEVEW